MRQNRSISRWHNSFQNPATTLSSWLQMDINRTCRPKVYKPASPQSPARPPAKHFIFGTVFLKFLNYQDFAFILKNLINEITIYFKSQLFFEIYFLMEWRCILTDMF